MENTDKDLIEGDYVDAYYHRLWYRGRIARVQMDTPDQVQAQVTLFDWPNVITVPLLSLRKLHRPSLVKVKKDEEKLEIDLDEEVKVIEQDKVDRVIEVIQIDSSEDEASPFPAERNRKPALYTDLHPSKPIPERFHRKMKVTHDSTSPAPTTSSPKPIITLPILSLRKLDKNFLRNKVVKDVNVELNDENVLESVTTTTKRIPERTQQMRRHSGFPAPTHAYHIENTCRNGTERNRKQRVSKRIRRKVRVTPDSTSPAPTTSPPKTRDTRKRDTNCESRRNKHRIYMRNYKAAAIFLRSLDPRLDYCNPNIDLAKQLSKIPEIKRKMIAEVMVNALNEWFNF